MIIIIKKTTTTGKISKSIVRTGVAYKRGEKRTEKS